jgi:CDP-glucose 4,6-dehydratase
VASAGGGHPLSRWKGVPVLVTGAQGFVGSWLAERLLDEGAQVVTLLRDVEPESRFNAEGLAERCVQVRADLVEYD